MDETNQLSLLTAEIYDAALDPSRWMGVLDGAAKFVGGFAAGVYVNRKCFDFGINPLYAQLYYDKYHRCDPRFRLYPVITVGEVFGASAAQPRAEFHDSQFFQEYLQPQDVSDNLLCVLERTSTLNAGFGLFRHQDNGCPATALRRMRLIMPHVRRAIMIADALDMASAQAASFTDALDSLGAGVFFLDSHQRIVFANASGQTMLAQGGLLRTVNGKLAANEINGTRRLDKAVVQAASGDIAADGKGIAVPLETLDGERYMAHLLPLTSGARRGTATLYQAVAALFIHRAGIEVTSPLEVIAKLYGLTPMELNVLLAIIEVGGLREVADMLGIARTTVKTHLARVFAKTDTRRQSDLVKLVAGLSNPLMR